MPTPLADRLRAFSFFSGFPQENLWHLSRRMRERTLEADETIFREGDPRHLFGIIVSGSVSIEKRRGDRVERLASLGAGEALGEGILLDDSPHGTSARTLERTELAYLEATDTQDILKDRATLYATLVARAAKAISERLRAAYATLVGRGRTLVFAGGRTREEHDLLGDREVPDDALYGIQTLRAVENFPITGVALREFPTLINALAIVKEAAALANQDLGLLERELAEVIVRAAQEIRAGRHHEHFLVDMIQGGAGTSTNMNANEVIANRALEILGHRKGQYEHLHPNDHVNCSQSTNDAYPTAIKLGVLLTLRETISALRDLRAALQAKGKEFADVLKMGRTENQDAVPMTLGQEIGRAHV